MSERTTFDSFEQQITSELQRYVASATDPMRAADIADAAMRPRGIVVRARNSRPSRRIVLLGLAAAFLVPATYIGASIVRPPTDQTVKLPLTSAQPSTSSQPRPTDVTRPTHQPSTQVPVDAVSIFVRREEGAEPGIAIYAVRPNGDEALLRRLPDSIAGDGAKLSEWGSGSGSGWMAFSVERFGGPWPMILVDLSDPTAEPWVINEANLGGIGPRWGPTGLVAAFVEWGTLIVADPQTRTTRLVSMQGRGLIGGGPSILWSADGTGIIGSNGGGGYDLVPIDGGTVQRDVTEIYNPNGSFGHGLAELHICGPDSGCASGADGRVDLAERNRAPQTIWRQPGPDRVLAAAFGREANEYWLSLDHAAGSQVRLVHLQDGVAEEVGMFNRDASWQYVAAPYLGPDLQTMAVWIDLGGKPATVLAPLNGLPYSFHVGHFGGFIPTAALPGLAEAQYAPPLQTMPPSGAAYRLPSLEELIAAELAMNPGRQVLGKAAADAVVGQTGRRTFEVPRSRLGTDDIYLDCLGPSSVTVQSGSASTTSPCLAAGSYALQADASGPITVTASGDTSWRVVIYSTP